MICLHVLSQNLYQIQGKLVQKTPIYTQYDEIENLLMLTHPWKCYSAHWNAANN